MLSKPILSSAQLILSYFICFIWHVVSNIEAIQSQLKAIYTNTLSTLCPLPWLEKSEDVQYNFDDVFIPLSTTNIDIQQNTNDLPDPSCSRDDRGQTSDQLGSSNTSNR